MATMADEIKLLTDAVKNLLLLQTARTEQTGESSQGNQSTLSVTEVFNQLYNRLEKYEYHSEVGPKPFKKWLKRHEYTITIEASALPEEMKTRLVIGRLGQQEFDRLTDHVAPQDPAKMKQSEVIDKLKHLFDDEKPIIRRRIEILNYRYDKNTPICVHIDRINHHATEFDRANLSDEHLKIVLLLQSLCYSSDNDDLKKIALRVVEKNPNASLAEVTNELEAHINVCSSLKTLENPTNKTDSVNIVHVEPKHSSQKSQYRKFTGKNNRGPSNKIQTSHRKSQKCNGCGDNHRRSDCPFLEAICSKCKKEGHIAKVCRSALREYKKFQNKYLAIRSVTTTQRNRRIYLDATIRGRTVQLQHDTGSDITIIGRNEWHRIGCPKLTPSESIQHAGGDEFSTLGYFRSMISVQGRTGKVDIHVAKRENINLLGLNGIDSLNLWEIPLSYRKIDDSVMTVHEREDNIDSATTSKQSASSAINMKTNQIRLVKQTNIHEKICQKFPDLFASELGKCTNFVAKLRLKPDDKNIQLPCRQIPYAMEAPLEEEIQRLVASDVLEVVESSDWSTPIVPVKKANNKIRLCADYSTGLNKALIDDKYPLPNVESVFSKLNGHKFFSQLDLSDAYLQIPIAEESRDLTTITTPKGLYRYKRLPFGIKTAPAIFQRAMDQTLAGMNGVLAYLDDILVMRSSREEHDQRLEETLQRLQDRGFRVNLPKCKFGMNKVKFLGFIVNAEGIKADCERTRAIANMPAPKNEAEVRSFLGMINHYGKFVPYLHNLKQPLEELTKKSVTWKWKREQAQAFSEIKKIMMSPMLLEHYDPSKALIVAADASATGIGGVLLQRDSNGIERAIYHMSQSLTVSQRNYSQLEKEALALVTAIERFHKFLWGRSFILQTDHKPLLALLRTEDTKGLKPMTAARLKRWAIRLLGYDFKIEYVNTEDFGQADALSRLVEEFRKDNVEELQVASVQIVETEVRQLQNSIIGQFGSNMQQILKQETETDQELQRVIKAIRQNWSKEASKHVNVSYSKCRESISIVQNVLMFEDRVVIPTKMRPQILKTLHQGHPGMRRMKQLARQYVYWPKITKEIENYVKGCNACALTQKMPPKVPLNPWPPASRPGERMHIDYAGPINNQYILVFVDAFSKFIEVALTATITAERTVELCREVFSRYGPPEILVSDHGTQFTAGCFANFCKEKGITHILSPVGHPQSNGQAERMVDSIKRAMSKDTTNWKKQLFDFLYSHRHTPCTGTPDEKSPAELFLGRKLRSPLTDLLPNRTIATNGDKYTTEMKRQFDRHCHVSRQRATGTTVSSARFTTVSYVKANL